jgi:hypothetical protein
MPGLKSKVNPLALDALATCATALEVTSVPGAGGHGVAELPYAA